MRYLKTYEKLSIEDIKNTCDDILLELTDLGFKTYITSELSWIRILISKTDKNITNMVAKDLFKIEEIKEYIDRIEEYLSTHGFRLDDPLESKNTIKTEVIRNPADFSLYGIRSFTNLWFSDKSVYRVLKTYEGFSNDYQPKTDVVKRWIELLKERYPIKSGDVLGSISKYIMLDDKPFYLNGSLSNKSRLVNMIFNEIKHEMSESHIHDPSLRRAIKEWVELNR